MAQALRKTFTGLVLILLGLTCAVAILEIFLLIVPIPNRFALNQQLAAQWDSDDTLLLHLKPNLNLTINAHPEFKYTVVTNSDGLRDEPFDNTVDIAAVGDSFTFGFGVEGPETWPSRLEAISDMKTANLGWAGWNSYVYPTTFHRHAIPLQAKVWICAFFVNDLTESAGAADFIESGQQDYLSQAYKSPPFPFNLRSFGAIMAIINPEYRLLPDSGNIVFNDGNLQMLLSHYAWTHSDPAKPEVQRGWELTEVALQEVKQLADENDASLLLVHIPAREHVYWPIIHNQMPEVNVSQLDNVDARLERIAQDNDILFLDLLPGFRAESEKGQMLYFPSDGHWNVAGHDLAARIIYENLHEQSLLIETQ